MSLAMHGLLSYAAPRWQRTTADLVQASDVLVFMEAEHQRFCGRWVEPARQRIEVWEIEDIGPLETAKIPAKVEQTFQLIRERVDLLLRELRLARSEVKGKF